LVAGTGHVQVNPWWLFQIFLVSVGAQAKHAAWFSLRRASSLDVGRSGHVLKPWTASWRISIATVDDVKKRRSTFFDRATRAGADCAVQFADGVTSAAVPLKKASSAM
jgi:hypothetical protein